MITAHRNATTIVVDRTTAETLDDSLVLALECLDAGRNAYKADIAKDCADEGRVADVHEVARLKRYGDAVRTLIDIRRALRSA